MHVNFVVSLFSDRWVFFCSQNKTKLNRTEHKATTTKRTYSLCTSRIVFCVLAWHGTACVYFFCLCLCVCVSWSLLRLLTEFHDSFCAFCPSIFMTFDILRMPWSNDQRFFYSHYWPLHILPPNENAIHGQRREIVFGECMSDREGGRERRA